ncbi:MAG: hypothetical protein RLY35_990 [Bacteroidota bacterium]|jgi:hypothetical protein
MRKIILGAVLACAIIGCKTKQPVVKEEDGLGMMQEMLTGNDGFITVDKAYVGPAKGDAFTILDVNVNGDSLYVGVQYSGGCKAHEFKMISNGNMLKSLPPQLPLYLEHQANGDNCRALKTEKLAFDLKPLRTQNGKKIKVFVNDDKAKLVEYSWE